MRVCRYSRLVCMARLSHLSSYLVVSSSSPSRRQGRPCGTGCPTKVALWADHQHDSERVGQANTVRGHAPVPRAELPLVWALDCRSALARQTWSQISRAIIGHCAIPPCLSYCLCQIRTGATSDRTLGRGNSEHKGKRHNVTGLVLQGPSSHGHL